MFKIIKSSIIKKEKVLCSVCNSRSEYFLTKTMLTKYKVNYFRCTKCHFIETEKPRYWLKKAYSSAIIDADTGIIKRNQMFSVMSTLVFLLLCKKKSKVLDYAGGYGILTRMLRDIGIDCYWKDKYAENIFAKHFVDSKKNEYGMVTAFEFFEHTDNPVKVVGDILQKYSPKIFLFSTELHNGNPPRDWWYFAENGGQHISLFTRKSLQIMATNFNLYYSTDGKGIHIFSKQKVFPIIIKIISVIWPISGVFFPLFYKSKTFSDHVLLK